MFLVGAKAFESLLRYWVNPIYHEIKLLRRQLMGQLDELNAAIENHYSELLPALTSLHDGFGELREQLAGNATKAELADTLARVAGSTNRIREAVLSVIDNPETPDPAEELPTLPNPVPEEPVVTDGVDGSDVPPTPGGDLGNVPEGGDPQLQ